ncbi:ATP-dependent DNA helicase PIF1-like protein [Tanacetum coccineum]
MLKNLDNRLIREALAFDVNKSKVEHEQLHPMLNPEQCLIYEQVIESVHNDRGRTAHSRFVIPLELMENNDEAPMTQRYAFEALDKTLRDIFVYKNPGERNRIIGGMTILLGGDFRLILPVIPKAKRPEIVSVTYPDFTTRQSDDEYLKERAILTPRNDDADVINEYMFKKLRGGLVTYNSADKICNASTDSADQHNLYPVEFLNSLNFPGMPPCPLLKKVTPHNAHSEYKSKSGSVQWH